MDTVDLPFRVDVDAQDERTVFRLAGELDMATVSQLEEALGEHENASEIVFDLRGLSFLDSMGLSVLVGAHVAGRDSHRKVSFVRGCNDVVSKVMQLTKMDDRLDWIDPPKERDEAV
ncbi:MAG TPA: STAS domain-containing protein [Actinomycetota bacterium]|nr:STAS domain-containing protein [Actinomycetota bacterium]